MRNQIKKDIFEINYLPKIKSMLHWGVVLIILIAIIVIVKNVL